MSWRHSSLIVLALVALLVGACGALPTDTATPADPGEPTQAPASADTPAAPEGPAADPGELVSADDYHVLGEPNAPVTIVEYSDFQ